MTFTFATLLLFIAFGAVIWHALVDEQKTLLHLAVALVIIALLINALGA